MPDTSVSTWIIQTFFGLGAGGTGAAAVTALLSRRKTNAEADRTRAETGRTQAEISVMDSKTSSEQVVTSLDLVREMRLTQDRMEAKLDRLEAWKLAHELRMDDHIRWDEQVRYELQKAGITVDPPPPLRA